jgi:hypothetical protein
VYERSKGLYIEENKNRPGSTYSNKNIDTDGMVVETRDLSRGQTYSFRNKSRSKTIKPKIIVAKAGTHQLSHVNISGVNIQGFGKTSNLPPDTVIYEESTKSAENNMFSQSPGIMEKTNREVAKEKDAKAGRPKDEIIELPLIIVETNKGQSPRRIKGASQNARGVFGKRFRSTFKSRTKRHKKDFDTRLILSNSRYKVTPQRSAHFFSKSPNRQATDSDLRMPFLSKIAKEKYGKRENKWNRDFGVTVSKTNDIVHTDCFNKCQLCMSMLRHSCYNELINSPMPSSISKNGLSHAELPKPMLISENNGSPATTNVSVNRK